MNTLSKRIFLFALGLVIALAFQTPVIGQALSPIKDPERFSADLIQNITEGKFAEVSATLVEHMGGSTSSESIKTSLQGLLGKKFDFVRKVADNEVSGALRQVIYYSYVESIGFVYFRFNFKMSSKGWILANFYFKSETTALFPKDFLDFPLVPTR